MYNRVTLVFSISNFLLPNLSGKEICSKNNVLTWAKLALDFSSALSHLIQMGGKIQVYTTSSWKHKIIHTHF